jgi:hypothetical protein
MLVILLLILYKICGPGSSVGIANELRAGRSGDRIPEGRDIPLVQTDPGAHLASYAMSTLSFPGVKYGQGVLLTTHSLLLPRSRKSIAILLPTLWTTTGPVTGTLYLFYCIKLKVYCTSRKVEMFVEMQVWNLSTHFKTGQLSWRDAVKSCGH